MGGATIGTRSSQNLLKRSPARQLWRLWLLLVAAGGGVLRGLRLFLWTLRTTSEVPLWQGQMGKVRMLNVEK
jgi:hypothetical protein